MKLLRRKLWRDIGAMPGQVTAVALVVGAGVAVLVGSVSTWHSLAASRDRFYAESRFPDVFVTLERAPLSILPQLESIDGVAAVSARIVRYVTVDLPWSDLAVSAQMVSMPPRGQEGLATLHLRAGSLPEHGDAGAVVVSEAFAQANGLEPGQDLTVLLGGRMQRFRITGIALSAEFVYAPKPGLLIPDDHLHGVLWVDRAAAEAAFDMDGAFDDLVVTLGPGADPQFVIAQLDRHLARYGSLGAIARRDQLSHRFLEDELQQQKVMSTVIPALFFAVSVFLLNVALGRIVAAQREQVAALKALGFPSVRLALHYFELVAVIVTAGWLLGLAGGWAFGSAMIESYRSFFRLPDLDYRTTPWAAAVAGVLSLIAAAIGAAAAVRAVVRLAPAVAMRPPVPRPVRRLRMLESLRATTVRRTMALRSILGRPLRAALTICGIALAVPMVVLGLFWRDAIDRMIEVEFHLSERSNVLVTFPRPVDAAIVRDLRRQPGVVAVEGRRVVPVRLRARHRTYRTAVTGLIQAGELRRIYDAERRRRMLPAFGVTLGSRLAEFLRVGVGDIVRVEVLERHQRSFHVPVAATVDEVLGMSAYMDHEALARLAGDGAVVTSAAMYVEEPSVASLSRRLRQLPVIESMSIRSRTLAAFLEKIAGLVLVSAAVLTTFALILAIGVVYNNVRIGFQERAWELASLRVLGFTRAEVARVMFEEFTIEIGGGVLVGLAVSPWLIATVARLHSNESFRLPPVVDASTYVAATAVIAAAAVASLLLVRRRIDRLDLVSVLKTRE